MTAALEAHSWSQSSLYVAELDQNKGTPETRVFNQH